MEVHGRRLPAWNSPGAVSSLSTPPLTPQAHGPAHRPQLRPRPRPLFTAPPARSSSFARSGGLVFSWHFLILNEVVLGDTRVLGVSSHFVTSDSFSPAFNPLRYRLKTVFSVAFCLCSCAFAVGTFYFDVVKSTNLSLVVSGFTASVGWPPPPQGYFYSKQLC